MKKIIFVFLVLLLSGCSGSSTPKTLDAPQVSLLDNVAYWHKVDNASGYNIEINGKLEFENSDITSVELKALDEVRVQAVSNNKKYKDSLWSDMIKYDPFADVQTYKVEWIVEGKVVEIDDKVIEGTIPSYNGTTPIKNATDKYSYEFIGWDKEIVGVTSDTKYTAVFKEIINEYSISFYDEEGNVLLSKVTVLYGEDVIFDKNIPSKDLNDGVKYTFDNWVTSVGGSTVDDLTNVTSNRNVYASYKKLFQRLHYIS